MAQWNPFITAVSDPLHLNARLSVRIIPPGKSGVTFKPTVMKLDKDRELRWLGRLLIAGLFDGEHYFLLGPDGDNGTSFTQGEKFNGLLMRFLGSTLAPTEAVFKLMNEALKAEVEKYDNS